MLTKILNTKLAIIFVIIFLAACSETIYEPADQSAPTVNLSKVTADGKKVTGEIEIVWQGGNGKNTEVQEKLAFAEFNAHEAYDNQPVRGEFYYRLFTDDMVLKREIAARVVWAKVEGNTGCFVAEVYYDSKGCGGGSGPGGHDSGCSGSSGGCGGDDTSHDGGCSGDHTDGTDHTDGGCSGDDHSDGTDHTDGGCGDDHSDGTDHTGGSPGGDMGGNPGGDTGGGCGDDHTDGTDHTDGGCSGDDHSDGTDHTDGGCGGDDSDHGGSGGSKGSVNGKDCRVGQVVFFRGYDGGTPATSGDIAVWKWFDPEGKTPNLDHYLYWKLCEKIIIDGNLTVHN